jgi:hypothetical protein
MSPSDQGSGTSAQHVAPFGRARDLADAIANTLRLARALVAAGRKVDIAGLDGPIGLLCAKSLDLSPEDGRQMRVLLLGILEEVDALSELLRTTTTDTPPQA